MATDDFFLKSSYPRPILRLSGLLAGVMLMLIYCSLDKSNNLPTSAPFERATQISEIFNIVWTLSSVTHGTQKAAISDYEPFHLIFGDSTFSGDDGCNYFGGSYLLNADSVFTREVSITEKFCRVKNFPINHLTQPFRLQIGTGELKILSGTSVYTYKSDFIRSVNNHPLIGKIWTLQSSNVPEFDTTLQRLDFKLIFDEQRNFSLKWYCSSANIMGCNYDSGIFGIGNDSRILFYPRTWGYSRPNEIEGNKDTILADKILKSTHYCPGNDSVTLLNNNENTFFEFLGN